MAESDVPDLVEDASALPEPTALETVRALLADARVAAENEITLLKTGGALMARAVRQFSVWATAALLSAFVGLIALSIGFILALANVVGPLLATLIVAGLMLAFAGFAAWRARAATRRIANTMDRIVP